MNGIICFCKSDMYIHNYAQIIRASINETSNSISMLRKKSGNNLFYPSKYTRENSFEMSIEGFEFTTE